MLCWFWISFSKYQHDLWKTNDNPLSDQYKVAEFFTAAQIYTTSLHLWSNPECVCRQVTQLIKTDQGNTCTLWSTSANYLCQSASATKGFSFVKVLFYPVPQLQFDMWNAADRVSPNRLLGLILGWIAGWEHRAGKIWDFSTQGSQWHGCIISLHSCVHCTAKQDS